MRPQLQGFGPWIGVTGSQLVGVALRPERRPGAVPVRRVAGADGAAAGAAGVTLRARGVRTGLAAGAVAGASTTAATLAAVALRT